MAYSVNKLFPVCMHQISLSVLLRRASATKKKKTLILRCVWKVWERLLAQQQPQSLQSHQEQRQVIHNHILFFAVFVHHHRLYFLNLYLTLYFFSADGQDYFSVNSQTVIFLPGIQLIQESCFQVTLFNDDIAEIEEYFPIEIESVSEGSTIGTPNVTIVFITDTDSEIYVIVA